MRARMLAINDMQVDNLPVVYTCYGLGSCIGLFIMDRARKLSAAAHIASPSSSAASESSAPFELMNALFEGLQRHGSDLSSLRAKLTGGSDVFDIPYHVGAQNVSLVLQWLLRNRVFVAATDLGGKVSRTARFDSTTGQLEISTSDQRKYLI